MSSRRGFILGVVVLIFMLLGVFLFSYNRMVRQQNIRAHHEMIGEIAGRLAFSGVEMLSSELAGNFAAIVQAEVPQLRSAIMDNANIDASNAAGTCGKALSDYQAFLDQIAWSLQLNSAFTGSDPPTCEGMTMAFENIRQISRNTDATQLQYGRDPVEKVGEVVISCAVKFRGLSRRATVRRQFRVVSMVPGVVGRFSLFVPFTPWEHSYNALGVLYEGKVNKYGAAPSPPPAPYLPIPFVPNTNMEYKHQVGGADTPIEFTNPLKIFNGTDTFVNGVLANDEADLKNRGWVFIGPCPEASTCSGPVYLKIPSGYASEAGGHFMFSQPDPDPALTVEIVPSDIISDVNHFHVEIPDPANVGASIPIALGGMFQGYFTYETGNTGAASGSLWPGLLKDPTQPWDRQRDRWLCAGSWLFPFGDRGTPSRTLMVGNVFAGFLRQFFIKAYRPSPSAVVWKGIFLGVSTTAYDPLSPLRLIYGQGTPTVNYQQVFKLPSVLPNIGLDSLTRVMPYNSVPTPTTFGGVSPGVTPGLVPFNLLFDFMRYDVTNPPAPHPRKFPEIHGTPLIAKSPLKDKPLCYPLNPSISLPPGAIAGILPCEDIRILFSESGGTDPNTDPDNFYFQGNLRSYAINESNLLSRITHYLNLSFAVDAAQEQAAFKDMMFTSLGANVFAPKIKGIVSVIRRTVAAGTLQPLELPGHIKFDKPFILIVNDGDLKIPAKVECTSLTPGDGVPKALCSLVALQGNILVGTPSVIHAYLIALNRPTTLIGPGGRVLGADGNATLNVYGGVACWEMGLYGPDSGDTSLTTMKSFTNGGEIRYNPMFNPSGQLYPLSWEFVMEEKPSRIIVTGAKP